MKLTIYRKILNYKEINQKVEGIKNKFKTYSKMILSIEKNGFINKKFKKKYNISISIEY